MSGWIKIHRSITEHWLYKEKRVYSKLEAWYDLLINVNYIESKTMIKGKLYEVKRGQSIMSLESWGKRWNWEKSKVRRFLNLLQNDTMIVLNSDNITTQITICNYDSYQAERNTNEPQTKFKRKSNENQTTPIEEYKEIKNSNIASFDKFWNLYGKSTDKQKCLEKFVKLTEDEIKSIFETLPVYLLQTPDKKYRKNPLTYLNGKCWNDIDINNPQVLNNPFNLPPVIID